jgi:hypothetical protein
MLVDGVSDLAQPRNDGVVVATDLERVPAPFGSHIDRLELDERDATFRPLAAVMDVPLIQGAILVRHRLSMGPAMNRFRISMPLILPGRRRFSNAMVRSDQVSIPSVRLLRRSFSPSSRR